ncbi:hypothetical protein OKA05_05610 [Luteolibacter arcticus]|uniref:Uncharacterized protein n=1 Tax=Luteolibacter arcticus TaxID=1581411 RepID=A0ABT3GEH9_9BACT|nr:hypothetical protein [Luteolibacter arcticus]MCW1922019.1 hypothetical protein [Luteolibacter arcticus]
MKTARVAAAFLLSLAAAHAQDVRKVAFRTLGLEVLPGLNEVHLLAATPKGKAVTVPVHALSMSPVVEGEFKGDEAVFFAKAGDTATPVAKGKLTKSKRQVLFFRPVKNEQGEGSYEIHAFDDDVADFKLGSVRAINLSPKTIRFNMAGKELSSIPPGGNVVYPQPKEVDEFGIYPAIVEAQGDGDAWAKVYSSSWKSSDRRREIVFVEYEDRFKQWSIKLMSDDPPSQQGK